MIIGLLRETKTPPDRRIPFTPRQASGIMKLFPGVKVVVQKSNIRAFTDEEFRLHNIELADDMSGCDILMGIKEVSIPALIPGKTYLFFSHTGKKQAHNRDMFREIVRRNITLIDYEYLADRQGNRLVAFGRWAGIVGAYKGLRAWGLRYHLYHLKPAGECFDLDDLLAQLSNIRLPPVKILITGGGRVAHGAMEILAALSVTRVTTNDYLQRDYSFPVYCQLNPSDYVRRMDGEPFALDHFFAHPEQYASTFQRFASCTDLFMPCHYWDPRAPLMLTADDYRDPSFRIRVIADISCDIGGPVASTLRPSTGADPYYGYHPLTGKEDLPFSDGVVTVMAVDNLPANLPRDASADFGENLIRKVLPSLLGQDTDGIIERATMVRNGQLTSGFEYLRDYLEGNDQ